MHRFTLPLTLVMSAAPASPAAAQTASPWAPPQPIDVERPRDPQLAFNRAGGQPTQLGTNVAPAARTTFAGQVVLDRAAPGALATEPGPPSLAASRDGRHRRLHARRPLRRHRRRRRREHDHAARVSVQDRDGRFTRPQELAADGGGGAVAASGCAPSDCRQVTKVPAQWRSRSPTAS